MYLSTQVLVSRLAERAQRPVLGDSYMYVDYAPGPGRSRWQRMVCWLADRAMAAFFYPARVVDKHLLGGPQWAHDLWWPED
jgi:hypothetical protein